MYPVSDSLSIAARERAGNTRRIRRRTSNRIRHRLILRLDQRSHQGTLIRGSLGNQIVFLRRQDILRRNGLLGRCRVLRHLPFVREKDSMRVLLVSTHVDQTTGYSKVAYNLLRQMATLTPKIKVFHFGFQRHVGHTNHRKVPEGVIA